MTDTNLLDPDLVMTVGDLVQGYNATERWMEQMTDYRAVMDRLRMPWYPVAGNHDIYYRGPNPPPDSHEKNFERHFGPLWYWFRHKNAGFIVLYSDEGDPVTREKGFSEARLTQMSARQLEWLSKTLEAAKPLQHVFVFLHHPRWITTIYPGSNWDDVHRRLVAAGNVTAVFAGHIHRLRYDGDRDGIEYHTLGATGADFKNQIPRAGFLHHFGVVSVRPQAISVAVLPVGAVIDPREMTPERHKDVDLLLFGTGGRTKKPVQLGADGSGAGVIAIEVRNPSGKPVEVTVSPETARSGVVFASDHAHAVIHPGESRELEFPYARPAAPIDDSLSALAIALECDYLADNCRITLPRRTVPIRIELLDLPAASADPGILRLDGETACLRLDSESLGLPDGPFTVEAFVRPEALKGRKPLISKAQNSEWGLFISDGIPSFIVHVGGKYASVKSDELIALQVWTHIAGVFDGTELRIYQDGVLKGRAPASGVRTRSDFPAFIGADPNERSLPVDFLKGWIDAVHISKTARYGPLPFTPKRDAAGDESTIVILPLDEMHGPWSLDRGPLRAHAQKIGTARCEPLSGALPSGGD